MKDGNDELREDSRGTDLVTAGLPKGISESTAAVCRSRLLHSASDILKELKIDNFALVVGTSGAVRKLYGRNAQLDKNKNEIDESIGGECAAREPLYSFDHLIVPSALRLELIAAIDLFNVEKLVFDEWGLRDIEPFPRTALNFHGPSGTGKTLAAHAIASRLKRKIMVASYAEIESKYHGDGPKNVKALFREAAATQAVLFIDEADSLLSKRLTNVTQGSDQAINSMRSQLLICLEQFSGIVIFSTNLVSNYDKAFETRVRHIQFELPDESCREAIWRRHLIPKLPLASDVSPADLAHRMDDVCGRDIKNAVIDAAVRAALDQRFPIPISEFVDAVQRIKNARIKESQSNRVNESQNERAKDIEQKVRLAIARKEQSSSLDRNSEDGANSTGS